MAKRKDDFTFGFTPKKKTPEPAPASTPADGATDSPSNDPFATPSDTSSDPFAIPSSDTSADPFATPGDASSSDPFATPSSDSSSDPFATPAPDTSSSDPFASTPTDTSSDPFATSSTDTSADPFATPSTDSSSDPFATTPTDTAADPFAISTPAAETPADDVEAPAATQTDTAPRPKEHKQFRILILADLSGRTNRGIAEHATIASRKTRAIDVDSFEKVMTAIKPELHLPVDEKTFVPLTFTRLEDFRPDAILSSVAALQGLLQLRTDLKDPKKFKATAAAVRKLTGEAAPKPKPARPAGLSASADSDFERLLNQTVAPKNAAAVDTDALIANLVAGYSVPDADPDQPRMMALVEDALSAGLRAILRHPAFQALEASWRGIEFLTSRLSTDEDLKLFVLDVSKEELFNDLNGAPTVEKSALHQLLIEQTRVPGAEPFSLVVGDYEFEPQPRDIALLAKLASLMHIAAVPFLAGASAKVTGFASFPEFARATAAAKWQPPADAAMWDKIRGHKYAAHLGLAAPRFLLRLPYGPKTDPIDTYPFDEMPAANGPLHEGYLWGNGAFAVALGIGQAFLDDGWSFTPGTDVADLPCHMTTIDGDKEMTPCAGVLISDRVADILHQLGLIPLLSVKNAPSVKIAGVHSLAKGGKPLAASWATA
jgi:type VI secretion system protein ImpC